MFVGFPNSSQVRHETRNKPTPEASYTHTHPPAAEMWGVPQMPPCSSLLKAGHGAPGVKSFPPALVLLHPLLLWSEVEAGREPGRQGDNFLVSLCPSSKSRWLGKKDIDLHPAHSLGL